MGEQPFRVIIVGAGPTGLYLACALSKANIDFVVLEQYHTIVNHAGAGILVWPHTTRLLDQVGLLDGVKEHYRDITAKTDLLCGNGHVTRVNPFLGGLQKSFGYAAFGCSRSALIKVLYEGIPDREKRVKPNSRVVNIETGSDGVKVHLKDGTVYEGSIVVGVDGVHSKTRAEIQRLSNASPGQHPMTTTFYGIYGRSTRMEGVDPGVFYESHGTNKVSQMFRVGDGVHYAFIKTIKTPTTEKRSYDAAEMEKVAEEFAEDFVSPTVKFKDVWKETDKITARLVNQEEGFAEKWYHERIALVGDAAHKMTSVTGQGVNVAMHSAAVFANKLRSTLDSNPRPTTKQLEEAFARYQKAREEESKAMFSNSLQATRLVTWYSWKGWIWDRFIIPWLDVSPMLQKFTAMLSAGQILDYVPFSEQEGTVAWLNRVISHS